MIKFLKKIKQSKVFVKIFSCLMIFSILLSCFIISSSAADDSMIGTWVFNDVLTPPPIDINDGALYSFDFNSAHPELDLCVYDTLSVYLYESSIAIGYYNEFRYIYVEDIYYDSWVDEKYKTIQILTEPTDEAFITWFKANATKQGSSISDPESPLSVFDVFGNISSYFYSALNVVSGLFYDSVSGSLTLLGAFSVIGLSLGLCFLLISILQKFLYLGG